MNNKTYDILKWVALVGLYALATLVNGIGDIWGVPYTEQIVQTINLIGTVLGIVLGISNINYKKNN
ncbi:MAG: phage holin [Acutalibacteraceae bacterium]|nr:phage holin [Acutalibacteraceae bacterium]